LKLKNYIKAISDANECLRIEPNNIKALTRKGHAFIGQKMYSEAYDTFEKVIDIDGSNRIAYQEMFELRKKMPPRNAFKMKIEEVEDYEDSRALEAAKDEEAREDLGTPEVVNKQEPSKKEAQKPPAETPVKPPANAPPKARIVSKSEKLDLPDTSHIPKMVKNLIVDEPTPFDKLTPKVKEKQRDTLIMPNDVQSNNKNVLIQEIN
jgi:tetratricopeptide (TPR) repeat protein